jgi:hypothetical protein
MISLGCRYIASHPPLFFSSSGLYPNATVARLYQWPEYKENPVPPKIDNRHSMRDVKYVYIYKLRRIGRCIVSSIVISWPLLLERVFSTRVSSSA